MIVGRDWERLGWWLPFHTRTSVFTQRILYLRKTSASKEHFLKFRELLLRQVHIIDSYRVYFDQVVASPRDEAGSLPWVYVMRGLRGERDVIRNSEYIWEM